MSVIKAVIDGQSIMLTNTPKIASNGINENTVEFEFDESWDGFGKTAMFYKEFHESTVYQSIIDSNGIASVPHEVTDTKGKICFGVVGTNGNIVYTTEVIKYNIAKGAPVTGSESEPPSPTIYQQMLSLVGQVQSDIDSFESDTNDRLDVMSSQMDEFIAEHAGTYGATVLWDSDNASGETISGNTQTVTLAEDCSEYDYIDIYFGDYVRTNTGADFVGHSQTFFEQDYNNKEVELYKWQLAPVSDNNPDGIHFKITYDSTKWSWSGNAIDDADVLGVSRVGWPFDKIVGRKLVADAELIDARVGVDGTVYQTAGAAIRGQINDVAGGTVELDTTLTQQGKAADAKAVGDKISEVKADLAVVEGDIIYDPNIWDGTVFDGVRTQANSKQLVLQSSKTSLYKTAKVKVSPNTTYTFFRRGSTYLGSLTSSQNLSISDFTSNVAVSPENVKAVRSSGTSDPEYFTFTTDANAEYLYVCYTITGETVDFAVYEGTYTTYQKGKTFYTKAEIDEGYYTKAEVNELVEHECIVSGNGTHIYISNRKMKYDVRHVEDESIHADLWRVYTGQIKTSDGYQNLWSGQDVDGVVRIAGEDDFLGGFHGDEILTSIKVFIDGVEMNNLTFSEMEYHEIVICQESNIYHCMTAENANDIAFKRYKILVFDPGGMTVKNHWIAQENLSLVVAYFGMLSVQKMQSDGATVLNNGYYTNVDFVYKDNETPTANNPNLTDVYYNTAFGSVGISMKNVTQGNYKGNVTFYSTGDVRLKTYMGPIIETNASPVSISTGDVLHGEARFFFA